MNKVKGNYTSSRLFTSKIHNFENLPEPRNATEEEQEEFHSKSYDFNIPDDINDFNGSNKQNSSKSSKIINIFKGSNDEKEITQKQTKKQNINIDDDDDDIHNNPNLHSNEQDEFEIPDDGF
ncbi:kinase-like domain-containing protein [Rhizophagus irregularis DAOM 181602=DAOM 197198]|nr:kinase-like domain-containing protein [Rhizophagus irregularis DAOM 181602=DAOM 197198]